MRLNLTEPASSFLFLTETLFVCVARPPQRDDLLDLPEDELWFVPAEAVEAPTGALVAHLADGGRKRRRH